MMLDHRLSRDRDHRVLAANAGQVIILVLFIIQTVEKYDQGGGARTCLHSRFPRLTRVLCCLLDPCGLVRLAPLLVFRASASSPSESPLPKPGPAIYRLKQHKITVTNSTPIN